MLGGDDGDSGRWCFWKLSAEGTISEQQERVVSGVYTQDRSASRKMWVAKMRVGKS